MFRLTPCPFLAASLERHLGTSTGRPLSSTLLYPLSLPNMPMLKEKNEVLPQSSPEAPRVEPAKSKRSPPLQILATALGAWLLLNLCSIPANPFALHGHRHHHDVPSKACEQADPVLPQAFNVSGLVPGNEVRIREWLMGAVKVPTEVFDVMGEIGEDPRWDVFFNFSACKYRMSGGVVALISDLEKAFPLV
jgi:hypothetical protein